ncbi:MAG: SIS domain-containing protein [Thermoanaerobaculia bacterium]|nr:SIS domain-containing protein [Thermoanaerobaculia bacterium]
MDEPRDFVDAYLEREIQILSEIDRRPITRAVQWLRQARDQDRTIFVFGNGGCSAIASQMVVDLVKCASLGRPRRFKAMCLSDNIPTLTAFANDEGYDTIFAEPLRSFAQPGDLVLGMSGSGDSPNVLAAIDVADEIGCRTLALTSALQGRLRHAVELPILVPSTHMGRLEDGFFAIAHVLVYAFIEDEIGVGVGVGARVAELASDAG